jgi:Subtilase family
MKLGALAGIGFGLAALISAPAVAGSADFNPLRAAVPAQPALEAADSLATTKEPAPATAGLSARLAALSTPAVRSESDREQALAVSVRPSGAGSLLREGDRLVASARVSQISVRLLDDLRGAGAELLGVHPDYLTVDLAIAAENLREVAAVDGVESVTEALEPIVAGAGPGLGGGASHPRFNGCTGSVVSEGDAQLRAGEARVTFGVDGTGTKVGVISNSFDTDPAAPTRAAQDVATADLPGRGNPCLRQTPVQVLSDQPARDDEGRAMLQLVHDVAPGAALAFATAFPTAEAMADNIRALRAAGASVIVDDISYLDEPMFQDGPISNAVTEVTAAGVPYFSSAANSNVISTVAGISGQAGKSISSYETPSFRPTACAPLAAVGTCMDFNPTATVDNTATIVLNAGRSVRFDLQWAQPRNGVSTDLDIYIADQMAHTVVAKSIDANLTTQKPYELVNVENPTALPRAYDIYVNKAAGLPNPRFKWVMLGGSGVASAEYDVSNGTDIVGPTIFGHNGAENAASVAAAPFNNSNVVEPFSSRGPVTLFFGPVSLAGPAAPLASPQVVAKPDIAATDGAQTTFFKPSGSVFRFSGTSAAAPHAAAVAALQLDAANGALSVPALRSAQTATASPVGFFGPEAAGAGLVNAVGAVGANPPQPPTTKITKMPKNKIHKKRATYAFESNAPEAEFQCRLDGAKFRGCRSPVKVVRIGIGRHQFSVRAVANGLKDPSPAKDGFKRK